MSIYASLIFPLLRRMDAETAHDRTLAALAWAQATPPGRAFLQLLAGPLPAAPVSLFGLTFPNGVGMAAGFDKDVRAVRGLALLGFGHIEVGTLTPRPQVGNPRPRIFRLPADGALINRMGFPNGGVATAVPRLKALTPRPNGCVIGVSLGKQKETPLADAAADYVAVMEAVYPYADYLAVNISSPNTPGLRDLQGGNYLGHLLRTLTTANRSLAETRGMASRPLLVKIAPDLSRAELDDILDAALAQGVDGIIATNTTIARDGLQDVRQAEAGGLSGRPLTTRANEMVATIYRATNGALPIIGVGGIATADDVRARLDAGASLVQLYTSLVYQGPRMVGRLVRAVNGER